MKGPRIHSRQFPVPEDAIDQQGHVSNLAYVAWMQDLAIEHSAAAGWPMARTAPARHRYHSPRSLHWTGRRWSGVPPRRVVLK